MLFVGVLGERDGPASPGFEGGLHGGRWTIRSRNASRCGRPDKSTRMGLAQLVTVKR